MPQNPSQPVIILTRPQMGENIGAAARAMLNFGLTEMRIVDPRDGWPNPRAVAMASGAAGQVLDRARVYPTLAEAMEGITYAFATTARGRELTKPVFTPATASAQARDEMLQKLKYQISGKWTALRATLESASAALGANGFVFNEGFYHPDVNAVAAPAFDKAGKPQYVVSCGGPNLKVKFMRDDIGPRISRLARKITVALAGRPA